MREFAAELFELNRLRRPAGGPQSAGAFPAKRDAGMWVPGLRRRPHAHRRSRREIGRRQIDVGIEERQVPRSMAPSMSTPCARSSCRSRDR